MVAALMARTRSRIRLVKLQSPCRSSAGSKVGIMTLSRLPHTRSDASHNAIKGILDRCAVICAAALAVLRPCPSGVAEVRAPHACDATRRRAQLVEDAPFSARLADP